MTEESIQDSQRRIAEMLVLNELTAAFYAVFGMSYASDHGATRQQIRNHLKAAMGYIPRSKRVPDPEVFRGSKRLQAALDRNKELQKINSELLRQNQRLEKRVSDLGWALNPERHG